MEATIAFLLVLLKGALAGGTVALVGFIKNLPNGETFNWNNAMPSVIVGLITGLVASYMNVDIDTATQFLAAIGITSLVNYIVSAVRNAIDNKRATGAYFIRATGSKK